MRIDSIDNFDTVCCTCMIVNTVPFATFVVTPYTVAL
jgi:hypothetical protein